MGTLYTPAEISLIYGISELRVQYVVIRYGLKKHWKGQQMLIAKADFYDFALAHPELLTEWRRVLE